MDLKNMIIGALVTLVVIYVLKMVTNKIDIPVLTDVVKEVA